MGAESHPFLKEFMDIDLCQFWRASAKMLEAGGYNSMDEFPSKASYDFALCLVPKQKEAAQAFLAKGALALSDGGTLMAAAANDAGGSRIQSWMQEMGFSALQNFSKNKARVVWGQKGSVSDVTKEWAQRGDLQHIDIDGEKYFSQPGLFGWNRIDQGSRLLNEYLPDNFSGIGADFGCGYGYLARQVLSKNPKIKKLYALDADARAMRAAKRNLENFSMEAVWVDLSAAVSGLPPLDFIVMNPPFHTGKKTSADLGHDFIRTARGALKPRGRLFMVANAHLPYEKLLEQMFSTVQKHAQQDGFKIFEARA